MKKATKILGAGLALIMGSAVFAGCGGGGGSANVDPFVNDYDPNKDYNIEFLGWGDAKEQAIYQRIINDGYTSDEGGIRHAEGLFESNVTFEEAKYMLVSCCAFVNYLIAEYGICKRKSCKILSKATNFASFLS